MMAWPTNLAFYNGYSLEDHKRQDEYNQALVEFEKPRPHRICLYSSCDCAGPQVAKSLP